MMNIRKNINVIFGIYFAGFVSTAGYTIAAGIKNGVELAVIWPFVVPTWLMKHLFLSIGVGS
tara:strand:- start:3619 stop:3804 length:186 start_codon:yes stop_codon:yes gene_type:complete